MDYVHDGKYVCRAPHAQVFTKDRGVCVCVCVRACVRACVRVCVETVMQDVYSAVDKDLRVEMSCITVSNYCYVCCLGAILLFI